MILGKFRISGHSMEPTLKNGQSILASSIPFIFSKPKIGDIVVFQLDDKFLVKRINSVRSSKFFVSGDSKEDSLKVSPIKKKEILGKMVMLLHS